MPRRFLSRLFIPTKVPHSLESGFTLLEMLIVVGIIGVLATLGTYSYNTAQRNARDIQRLSDISSLQKGMEQYFAHTGEYTCSESALIQSGALPDGFPTDPKSNEALTLLSSIQEFFARPLAGRSLVPQAYAQGTCSFCINDQSHTQQCAAMSGTVGFSLSCNSTQCCFLPSGGATPPPSAAPSPVPSAVPTPSPSSNPGGQTGGDAYTLGNCTTASYCVCARLERPGTGNASSQNCTWQKEGDFFCVEQAQ